MAESAFSYVAYDLNRRRGFDSFIENHDWEKLNLKVGESLNRHRRFDLLKKEFHRAVQKENAITSCLNFLACNIPTWQDWLAYLDRLTTALPQRRPDMNDEVQKSSENDSPDKRYQSLFRAQILDLDRLCDIVRSRRWEGASWFEGPHLLYRVHGPDSHTFYDEDIGLCCQKWLREPDFDEPSKQDFYHHVNGDRALVDGAFETPYISMTGSPLRALNLVRPEAMSSSDVFVIYSERLWATNIRFERTTTIADRYGIKYRGRRADRAHYITKTHWVAQHWIPADCIIMRMPFLQFQAVCSSKGIFRGANCPSHPPSHESWQSDV